ncbi:unnamed protein product [Darwinula stevensoni]|uniref:Septin-type G domain-containing protein n=1 Tax=Darwinula stevensoni TaxID=69355 RepID=A0A7R9AEV6_9CRUS|nr:unnamed protein product [Darwinula stevensoni]CAG0902705.1 unnamed protein product [Darwinula stevensoni]
MIATEEQNVEPGYDQRIKYLKDARGNAELTQKLRNDFDPFESHVEDFEKQGLDISRSEPATSSIRGPVAAPRRILAGREGETNQFSLAHKMRNQCKENDGFIYRLPKKIVMEDAEYGVAKYEIGDRGNTEGIGKVLMVVGASRAGKKTFINGMVNYLYNVKWEDDFRFKLIEDKGKNSQAYSQTTWITTYVLHKQKGFAVPFTLTVIDTPSFGDTEEIKEDDELANKIREFLSRAGNIVFGRLEQLQQEYAALKQHEAEAEANMDFEYKVVLQKQKKVRLGPGENVTNCLICHISCHYPCHVPKNKEKGGCSAMNETRTHCKVCPGKCPASEHCNNDYRLEWHQEQEVRRYTEMKVKYEKVLGRKMNSQEIVQVFLKQFKQEKIHALRLTKSAQECMQKLKKMAFQRNPLGLTEFIDVVTETPSEKDQTRRWMESHKDARTISEMAEKLEGDFYPFDP